MNPDLIGPLYRMSSWNLSTKLLFTKAGKFGIKKTPNLTNYIINIFLHAKQMITVTRLS